MEIRKYLVKFKQNGSVEQATVDAYTAEDAAFQLRLHIQHAGVILEIEPLPTATMPRSLELIKEPEDAKGR